MKRSITLLLCIYLQIQLLISGATEIFSPAETVWFNYPAKDWSTQALHIGNGYFGASFYGDVQRERLDIAEKTFWAGGPHSVPDFNYGIVKGGKDKVGLIRELIVNDRIAEADSLSSLYMVGDYTNYGYFSMVGNLYIDFNKGKEPVTGYVRGLDLSNSIGFVQYNQDGVNYKREYFCSYPDKLMALHFTADKAGQINFNVSHELLYKPDKVLIENDELIINGLISVNGLRYSIRIKVLKQGGEIDINNQQIKINGADQATVLYTVDTEYKQEYPLYKGEKPEENTRKVIKEATRKGYQQIKQTHITDYKNLYDRVKLTLIGNKSLESLPTDERIKELSKGTTDDSSLKTLWFNLSRYLVISASRSGTLPSTLQGTWNTFEKAPWNGNFQSNINLQEMYWGCGPTNLPECELSYLEWIENLVESGRQTAKEYYDTNGWVSHSTGNIWGHTVPGDDILWGLYPVGSAWHCRHIWEHYAFTGDKKYLKERGYAVMKEAAEFWLDNMVEFEGHYIIAPSVSAEHGIELENGKPVPYSTTNGEVTRGKLFTVPAYQDIEMVYDLYSNVIKASEALDTDHSFRNKVIAAKDKLLPLQIGKYGQLQEWVKDVDNPRNHHRHIAHLYAMHPGNMISTTRTPELANAVKKSLEMRGDGKKGSLWPHTGGNWSAAWRTALWTKLFDGDRAISIFNKMIRESGYENMMSNQSGNMQVDATMATSGLFAEMLLQSHESFIHLLPALTTEWPEGKITGLLAREGYVVNIEWKNGQLTKAEIQIPQGKKQPLVRINNVILSQEDKRVIFDFSTLSL